jgi:hypothetical protein
MFRYLFKHRRESDENVLRKFQGISYHILFLAVAWK